MTISAPANSKSAHPHGVFQPTGFNPVGVTNESIRQVTSQATGHSAAAHDLHQTRERIVFAMMALVAAAIAAVMRMHLGYAIITASVLGTTLWAGFLALHTLRKRSAQISRLRQDVSRLEQEIGRLRPESPVSGAAKQINAQVSPSGSGAPKVEAGTSKAKSQTGSTSPPADAKRIQPVPSASASLPQSSVPPTFGPGVTGGAPERISSEARWETPELGRASKFMAPMAPSQTSMPGAKPDTNSQNAAPTLSASKADRPATAAVLATSSGVPPRAEARTAVSDLFDAPSWSGTSITSSEPLRDAWSFRPKEAVEPRPFAPDAGSAEDYALRIPAPLGGLGTQGLRPRGIDADLEMVQRKIKAMAEEVNAAEASRQRPLALPERATAPAEPAAMGAGYAPISADFGTAAMAIEDGISALKSAAGAMRSPVAEQSIQNDTALDAPAPAMFPPAELLIPATAQTIAVSAPQVSTPAAAFPRQSGMAPATPTRSDPAPPGADEPRHHETRISDIRIPEARIPEIRIPETLAPDVREIRLAEIAKAIETKNMDVLLSPIVGLGDYAVTHFEVSVRLRATDGAPLERPEEALTLAGNHLLALFDAERLSRTAAVAELLESRGKNGSIMTAASGASMSDTNFLETFARVYETRNSISGQLVLTFSQADVEAFGNGTWQALSDMHSFGFRFALDHVTHLGMDFEHLAQCGFTFVKLPAKIYLKGLPSDSGFITVNDICRHLARCGLTLVVESVDDEALLARVFGFGALFGQGQLFGAPRQISLDSLSPAQSAAA